MRVPSSSEHPDAKCVVRSAKRSFFKVAEVCSCDPVY